MLAALAVIAATLPVLPNTATATDPPPVPSPPRPKPVKVAADLNTAVKAARQQGTRVEAANLRAEDRLVYAEPKGTAMVELSAGPVRVKKKTGWVAIDTNLTKLPNGTIAPKAASADVAFSGGGTAPMVTLAKNGKRIAFSWPGRLPTPRISGPTATYPNVRPGVDLVLRAERTGYTQHLVVKNPTAARALSNIRFGMTTTGVRVTADKFGALQARDAKRALVFTAPPAAMWDSKALRSVAKVAPTSTALTLTPDQKLLRNPRAKFPIIVDPNWHTWARSFWTSVSSGKHGTAYPNSSPGGDVAQVGNCGDWPGCNSINIMRSYFQYDTYAGGLLVNKRIMGVWLDTSVVHSPDCFGKEHKVFGTSPVHGGTSWDTAPVGWEIARGIAPGVWNSCGGAQLFSFGLPTNHINPGSTSTYFIAASNESDKYYWRKYNPHATNLRVRFNAPPSTPHNVHSQPAVPAPCRWCNGTPYMGGSSMDLWTGLSDPDGNAVQPEWHIYKSGAGEARFGTPQASGAMHSTPISLPDGATIDWYVQGWDHDEDNGNRLDNSGFVRGPGAPFVVDRTAPSSAPKVTGLLYKKENRWRGGVGVPGTFRLERTKLTGTDPGTADVNHYLWGTRFPPTTKVDATGGLGGPASITFTPTTDGPQDIFVQSVDRAGNVSPTETYHFYVRAGNGPVAQYSLDGNTKDTAYLGDRDGGLQGGTTYVRGAVGSALRLDGEHTSVMTAPSALPMDTSFTVSAWVKLDERPPLDDHTFTVLSQDGSRVSGLFLGYRRLATGDRWEFFKPVKDVDNATGGALLRSSVPAHINTWTHLTAVHDAQDDQIRLYVNGVKAGTAAHISDAAFDGLFRISGSVWNGSGGSNPWPGLVDEVRLYDRELTDAEVRTAVGQDNVHAGHWRFDEPSGSTARNQVDGGESMVLYNDAAFTGSTGGAIDGGVQLDGTGDYAATTNPAIRTDQSFTVAAWVNATGKPSQADYQAAVSAEGAVNSAFTFGYRELPTGSKWDFVVPSADAVTRPPDAVIRSNVTAALNTPTHLAGVYDAAAGQVRLYVNGQLAGTAARPNGFNASGPLTVGRGRWENAIVDHWTGVIDDVRAYSRELSESEIQGIVARSNVTAGTWKLDNDARDSSGKNRHGTLHDASWTGGQVSVPDQTDRAVRLNGTSSHIAAPNTIDLTKSFAVATWAKLDGSTDLRTVLSQDGNRVSGFKLRATTDAKWSFVMFGTDADGGGARAEVLGGTAQVGAWTHLVAMYDASAKQISLYVNGVLVGAQPHSHGWNHVPGQLQIGRAKWDGGYLEYFPGAIDDVTAYSRVLFADEVRKLAGRDLSLVHNWTLDEPTGGNAADSIGNRGGAINGAKHVPGRLGNALDFDGTDDATSTSGLDVDTSKSFTIGSWVQLRKKCDRGTQPSCRLTAVSMDGGQPSKFRLGHIVDDNNNTLGAWIFEMPEADGIVIKASVSAITSDVDKWVHLVGVYDQPANQIWLYVNATRQDDGTLDNAWSGSGGLQLGRGRVAGQPAQHWDGAVDDVRVYDGALDASRIENLFFGYPPERAPATLPPAKAGYWKLNEGTGANLTDSSGRGLNATLKGGATWVGGRSGSGGRFDGVDDFADTAGPVLNTANSFSASAWVYLNGNSTGHRTILAQDGSSLSAFLLQYQDENKKWAVLIPGTPHTILTSAELAARDEWTHLMVVYDADTRQLKLYVQGVLSGAITGVTVPTSSGPFSIGRAKWTTGNADFFTGGIDEVRAFDTALNDDEVRKVHADMAPATVNFYKFDNGTGQDYAWRNNTVTASGTHSYGSGVYHVGNKALHLDGSTGSAASVIRAVVMEDDFTVSAWAKLNHPNQVATVLAQDGQRRSGFVLQYRPGSGSWVFGGPADESLAAQPAYAIAAKPARTGEWTQLTGVYDHGQAQLRIYVNGELAGLRNGVTLPDANGALTVGRAKYDDKPVDFFPGAIDEVRTEQGIATPEQIQVRGGWPAPPSGQQIGRYVNATGEHYTDITSSPVRPGYHFEGVLGRFVADGPTTKPLYNCLNGADYFSSDQADCEGKTIIGPIGRVFSVKPTNLPSEPINRCNTGTERFDSRTTNCEGQPVEKLLGYTLAYAPLHRYSSHDDTDHWTTVHGTPPSYILGGHLGWLPQTPQPGAVMLMSCLDGADEFSSTDAACEGKTVVGGQGYLYTSPPADVATAPLYRCNANGGKFTTRSSTCEGPWTMEKTLGHIPLAPPAFP